MVTPRTTKLVWSQLARQLVAPGYSVRANAWAAATAGLSALDAQSLLLKLCFLGTEVRVLEASLGPLQRVRPGPWGPR